MQYETQMTILHEDMLEDDIDILFHQLQPIEPPPSFVSHILLPDCINRFLLHR